MHRKTVWNSSLVLLFAISTILVGYGSCSVLYTIVSPQLIRPNSDYNVAITLHNVSEPTTVSLSIKDGLKYKNTKAVTINSNKTKMVTLHIDNLDVNKGYKFVAEIMSGVLLKHESSLKVESKNVSIFIQTDKSLYKPGEKIKLRVLVLDYKLKPTALTANNSLNVYMNNPDKTLIKQWVNEIPKTGVFSSEIQLSELSTLGRWVITAQVQNEKKTREVEVAKYVLPKFEVIFDSPKDFSSKFGKIRAIIRSKYTFGKAVKGEVIVSLTPPSYSSYYGRNEYSKKVPTDGKAAVEFDIVSELQYNTGLAGITQFLMKATVIEELTGLNQTNTQMITIHPTRYKYVSSDKSLRFTPGTPMKFTLTISHHDDSKVLLNDRTKSITIAKYNFKTRTTNLFWFEINPNGTADIQIPTFENESHFELKLTYMGDNWSLGDVLKNDVSEPGELDLKVLNETIKLGEHVFCEVQSKHLLQNFTYQVIAHGKVIYAENVEVPNHQSHVFQFMATFDLVPQATIIVYRFHDGNFTSTSTDIEIEEDLNNFIKLRLSKNEVKPGENIDINVMTKSASHVGLIGVDQSVLLLKQNKAFTREDAVNEMKQYQNNYYNVGLGPWAAKERHYEKDLINAFQRSNVIIFSNGIKEYVPLIVSMVPHSNVMPYSTVYRNDDIDESDYYYEPRPVPVIPVFAPVLPQYSAPSSSFSYASPISSSYSESPQHSRLAQFYTQPSQPFYTQPGGYSQMSPPVVEPPKIRSEFPETWLWEDFEVNGNNGTKTLTRKVPDTITSWVLTGFSLNPEFGLGLTKTPSTVNVFQPFFVSLNLPYSVKRGEVVSIPVVIFNYMKYDIQAELTIHNENDDFEFIDDENDTKFMRKRQLNITSNNGVSVNFIVKFNKVGQIPIKLNAISAMAGDAIERLMLVEPEGVPQFVNKAVFVDLRKFRQLKVDRRIDVPANAVEGSLKINVNALGDMLGGTIQNLHQLINLPTGCGEQRMLQFVPNIVILDYLKASGQLKPDIESKAIKYLISGYQGELTYRHNVGSFSAFGQSDRNGSTWLTAFVAKSFKQAKKYIDIDSEVISKSLDWLTTIQAADGSFPEVGSVSHKTMQGGSSNGVALTAYTAIAVMRAMEGSMEWKHQSAVNRAITHVAANVENINNKYAEAIAAYALQLADHPKKDEVLNRLITSSLSKNQHKWWVQSNDLRPVMGAVQSKSINVELTSYGLLALIEAKRYDEAFPYFKWLLAQRNEQGGFHGTQDTVIGLEALAKYTENLFLSSGDKNVRMNVQTDVPMSPSQPSNETIITVNRENALVHQTVELPAQTRSVQLNATGYGYALFQLSYRYNLLEKDIPAVFDLIVRVTDFRPGQIAVEACSSYKETGLSNMVILEVGMPSGFIVEREKLSIQMNRQHVKLAETKQGETVAVFYFDQMQSYERICVQVHGYRSHKVAENKPIAVRLYDYYDSSKSATEFYEIPSISSCDICEGDECLSSCR